MPVITDEQRALIGRESAPRPAPQAVNPAMASHWCEMVEDPNPIYHDDEYAKSTWLDGTFAPPTMLFTWGIQPVWPERDGAWETDSEQNPFYQLKFEGCTNITAVKAVQEYLLPLRYGDSLTVTNQVSAVSEEKTTRLGVGHFVTRTDTFRNQLGQVVGTQDFTLFFYRPTGGDSP